MRRSFGWIIAVAALGVLVALVLAGKARQRAATGDSEAQEAAAGTLQVRVARVTRGPLSETLHLMGVLDALPNKAARVSAQLGGRILTLPVKRGDSVRAGQMVATIYNADLAAAARAAQAAHREAQHQAELAGTDVKRGRETQDASLRQAEAALRAAQARLDRLRAGNRPEEIAEGRAALQSEEAELTRLQSGNRPEEIAQAEAELRATQAELDKLKAGPRPQELAQAEAALREAQAAAEAQKKNSDRVAALFDDGLASAKDKERAAADLAAAQARLEQAQQQLKLLREGTRAEDIRAQEAKVRQAQAQLQLMQAGFRSEDIAAQKAKVEAARQALAKLEAGARAEDIREAEADLEAAHASLAQVNAGRWQLQATDLGAKAARSKAEGAAASRSVAEAELGKSRVLSPVSGIVGDVFVNAGEVAEPGTPLLDVVNADALRVIAHVPAAHEARLRVGAPATVTFPHLARKQTNVSVNVVGTAASSETGMIPIELLVPNPDHQLKKGMAADVALSLDRVEDALLVPASAVFSRVGETYVYVVGPEDEARERLVEVGAESGDKVQILKGLKESERVVVDGTLSLADGAEVKALE